jgi:RNA polymerase-binding transcription factor DksA
MDSKTLGELEQKLKKDQARLRAALGTVANEKKSSYEPKFEDFGTDTEASEDEVELFEENIGTKKALEPMLTRIEHALDKIQRGVYGVCEKCGEEIPLERLQVAPEAEYCLKHVPEE